MTKMKRLAGAIGLSLLSAPAFADSGNLLTCVDRGFVLQKCKLVDTKLSDGIVEDQAPYETQFLVQYDFPCSGHSVQLGARSGDATQLFVQGATGALISLNGVSELHPYDPSPNVTRSLTFKPGCRLNVTKVTLLPSTWTVQLWTDQAKQEAKILDLSTNLYLLSTDYQNLSSWNVDNLQILQKKLQKLVVAYPTNGNYTMMLTLVNDALQNQPLSATLDELKRAGEDVIQTLRGELDKESAVAQGLFDRFTRWQLATEWTLTDALDRAQRARQSS